MGLNTYTRLTPNQSFFWFPVQYFILFSLSEQRFFWLEIGRLF